MATLDDAVQFIRTGERDKGRQVLEELLEQDESDEQAWLWLSAVADESEREVCLENVLAVNPDNAIAKKGLEAVKAGKFNVNEIMAEALEEYDAAVESGEEEEEESGEAEEEEDEDLEAPRKGDKKKGKAGGGLNPRLIALAVIGVVVALALCGIAAVNLLGGSDSQPEAKPTVAQGQETAPTPAATFTPAPTDTPTVVPMATKPALTLPTALPTRTPSPMPTQVVPPTVAK